MGGGQLLYTIGCNQRKTIKTKRSFATSLRMLVTSKANCSVQEDSQSVMRQFLVSITNSMLLKLSPRNPLMKNVNVTNYSSKSKFTNLSSTNT